MRKATLFVVFAVAAAGPASADSVDGKVPRHITCEMVRADVAQMGAGQARAVALAHGMTPSQERRARRCLSEEGVSEDTPQ